MGKSLTQSAYGCMEMRHW